jgi:hypothetical protein
LVADESAAKEMLKLRRKIEDLEAQIAETGSSPPAGSESLAQGDEIITIRFSRSWAGNLYYGEEAFSWYPSYFSLLRTGAMPFETAYGISHRRLPQLKNRERAKIIPNLALFGRPIETGLVTVTCINTVVLNRVEYGFQFGPVGC